MPKAGAKGFYDTKTYRGRNSVGYLVHHLHTVMMPRIEEQFSHAELTFSQWVVLKCLRDSTAQTCADISRHMNHDTGATTRLVDQLERRRLLKRTRSTTDRRIVHLKLLQEGKALVTALTPRMVDFWNLMLEHFSHREVDTLIDLLTRLSARLESTATAKPQPRPIKIKASGKRAAP